MVGPVPRRPTDTLDCVNRGIVTYLAGVCLHCGKPIYAVTNEATKGYPTKVYPLCFCAGDEIAKGFEKYPCQSVIVIPPEEVFHSF